MPMAVPGPNNHPSCPHAFGPIFDSSKSALFFSGFCHRAVLMSIHASTPQRWQVGQASPTSLAETSLISYSPPACGGLELYFLCEQNGQEDAERETTKGRI